ncbi:helix-turn-helix domain-containing protein [Micromonospora sp. ATA32]|nr:helix-turn-helix domain-containing protein [Micromonospora sp. ATA32]
MSGVQLRYNFRVYPTPRQQEALARAFGCARVVFNDGLRARQEAHEQGLPYRSPEQVKTRQLIDGVVPLIDRLVGLSRLRVLRPVTRQALALIRTLRH